jgi:hypothetical protein
VKFKSVTFYTFLLVLVILVILWYNVQETLHSLAQATCGEHLNSWLLLCKDILATSSDNTRSTMVVDKSDKNKDDDEEEVNILV